ncbi:UDP-glucose 4-epimerase GalE [Clostridia bacterium]|nr:UDP-glucose 4-epimerase GalE [Clostridia bacterium]
MNNLLICGGAGYIGSHCLRVLRDTGYNCIVYDNLSEGHRQAVRGFPLEVGELSDTALLADTIRKYQVDSVLHFAAFALVGVSMHKPIEYYQNNIAGTASLLDAMCRTGVKRIVFSSTCATYGENVPVPITEDVPQNPCNPYGESKLAVEKLLQRCDDAYGIKSVALRYFNAAGAMPDGSIGEDHKLETHLIPLVLREALRNEGKLKVFGTDYQTKDGSCVRDYIHVLDLAVAHLQALRYLECGGVTDCFNLGTGVGSSVFELINTAREITGIDIKYRKDDRREGDPATLVAAFDKARNILGWNPEHSNLHTIISDAWAWHKTHPNGFEEELLGKQPPSSTDSDNTYAR